LIDHVDRDRVGIAEDTSEPSSRRMRLTVLVTGTQRRGAEVFGEQLSEGLLDHGWDVDFVALTAAAEGSPSVGAEPLTPARTGGVGVMDLQVIRALRRRLRRFRPDIVLANGSATLRYSVAVTRTLRHQPKLVYVSIGDPTFWASTWLRRMQYRLLLSAVDRIVSVSTVTAQATIDSLRCEPDRVLTLHTGVDERFLDIPLVDGHRHGQLRLLFLGSLSPEKDPIAAVEVAAQASRFTPVELRLVGGGVLASEVVSTAARLGIGDAVDVQGPTDDVAPHLAWADVLILTSRTEGLPGVALEAAAAGVAVVAFDVGGVTETVIDGVTGRVVPARDVTDAAAAVVEMRDDAVRLAAGRAGRELVSSHFTLTEAVVRYDRALKAVVGSGS
jgi:glycosyltransferase involved in cell wall biosynthesis